ncbi:MAG: polyphosphate kinase 2 [Hyphomicrobiaceae bacterium]
MKTKKDKEARRETAAAGPIDLDAFDIDDPVLPKAIDEGALTSGSFPYDKRLKGSRFEEMLRPLQIELLKLQSAMQKSGERLVVVFEGRDAAGKGGAISVFSEHLNPRHAHVVALAKPTEAERGEWYFQRYIERLPTAGDMVLFDRSWYNRAGVERVMGFCTQAQLETFFRDVPAFESLIVRDGIRLVKIYLKIGRETQLKRFHTRYHDPLKRWKLTEIDLAAMKKWQDYSIAQEEMLTRTHSEAAPWTVILANDKLRARLAAIQVVLSAVEYEGRDASVIGRPDGKIAGSGGTFFAA